MFEVIELEPTDDFDDRVAVIKNVKVASGGMSVTGDIVKVFAGDGEIIRGQAEGWIEGFYTGLHAEVSSVDEAPTEVTSPPPWEQGYEWRYGTENGFGLCGPGFFNVETQHFIGQPTTGQAIRAVSCRVRGKVML